MVNAVVAENEPPLIVSAAEVDVALDAFDGAVGAAYEQLGALV